MLTLIIAESALETIPKELWKEPAVQRCAERRGKKPWQILLDRSYHHSAMRKLKNASKRGRPDIVHISLLEALGSPLNKEGSLRIYLHTINDYVISVDPTVRLPRNYDRFVGLIEQLFELGKIPPTGRPLMELKKQNLTQLLSKLKPPYITAFTRVGKRKPLDLVMAELVKKENPVAVVGGFPRGHFAEDTLKLADEVVCIDPEGLETWTVVSRIIYEYERLTGLPSKRLRRSGAAAGI